MAKLQANVLGNVLEIEGTEEFIWKLYNDFKESFLSTKTAKVLHTSTPQAITQSISSANDDNLNDEPQKKSKKKQKSSSISKKITLLELDRDFINSENERKFREKIKEFIIPSAHDKKITLFVYVMQKIGMTNITLNQIFSCYRQLSEKTPNNLRQAVIDSKNKKCWIVNEDWTDIKTHHKGEEMVEFELTQKSNQAA